MTTERDSAPVSGLKSDEGHTAKHTTALLELAGGQAEAVLQLEECRQAGAPIVHC